MFDRTVAGTLVAGLSATVTESSNLTRFLPGCGPPSLSASMPVQAPLSKSTTSDVASEFFLHGQIGWKGQQLYCGAS